MKINQNINLFSNMDFFVSSLKKEDLRNERKTHFFQIIMWALAIIYGANFVINPNHKFDLTEQLGGLCFSLSFIVYALILNRLNHKFRFVDYGQSVTEMLRSAIKRYSLSGEKSLMVIVPVLLTDVATVLLTRELGQGRTLWEHILRVQGMLIPAFVLGAGIGITIWYIRKKPLRDAAMTLLKEIES